jgi:hypothetical protein
MVRDDDEVQRCTPGNEKGCKNKSTPRQEESLRIFQFTPSKTKNNSIFVKNYFTIFVLPVLRR